MEYVADIGTAWLGRMDVAKRLIECAKGAGATDIKPQWFHAEHYAGHPLEREAVRCCLTPDIAWDLIELIREADLGVQFSVWDVKDAEALFNMGVRTFKVACSQNTNFPLLDALHAMKLNNLNISCEDHGIVEALEKRGILDRKAYPYFCVPKYPTKLEEIRFPMFSYYDEGVFFGFSDHTLGWEAAMIATALGAQVIEKHIRLSAEEYREAFGVEYAHFPDELCAVDPAVFAVMVDRCDVVQLTVRGIGK